MLRVQRSVEFKDYLRRHLATSGVRTQTALALELEMDYGQLNKIFMGRTKRPEPETVRRIAEILKRPPSEALLAAGYPASIAELPAPAVAGSDALGPRVVRVITRRGERDLDLDKVITYVEAKPEPEHQEMIARWKEGMTFPDYERVVLRLYLAWDSNADAVQETIETLRPDLAAPPRTNDLGPISY